MNNAKGGAERVLSIVVNGLADKGYEVTLLTFDERGLDTFYDIGSNVKRISLGIGNSGKKAGLSETVARMRAIRKIIKVRQPDIVIPFMHSMFIPVAFTLFGLKTPIIASEHIVPQHYKKKGHEYLLLLLSFLLEKKK